MVMTVIIGLMIGLVGAAWQEMDQVTGGILAATGLFFALSVMFSWVGHIVGAPLLEALLRRGLGGWAIVMLCGGIVGGGMAVLLGSAIATWIGPVLALLQLIALRCLARVFARRRRALG
ncbi:hypothetical protein VK792_12095 [Mesobacterium sp. TK19101]|uniref:Major facilitator superfamily (MFS) profile domain-containing protein n=1 Tax=Mesobacterium hydrothermale TaxID=3111907 RepID=A0ABU6HKR1_9RHOB|nr:hypothetical protein [Mesobacterium sp. TK19101]MEC3862028.1 hypothetical protein [Mesobacterium sp. TK19101]